MVIHKLRVLGHLNSPAPELRGRKWVLQSDFTGWHESWLCSEERKAVNDGDG